VPLVSDVAKIPFTGLATAKAFGTGNPADGVANLILGLGQVGWAVGKYGLPKWLPTKYADKLNEKWKDSWKNEFGKEVYLLELGVQLVTMLTVLHGSATDKGQNYELGSASLELAWESLKDATASDASWSGDAADAYNVQNAAQLDWATAMAELDTQIAAILALQAGQIKDHKLYLTYCRAVFTAAIPPAVIIRMYSPPASWLFQIGVFTWVMAVAVTVTGNMMTTATDNAMSIDTITAQYAAIANGAVVTGLSYSPQARAVPARGSSAGQFDTPGSTAAAAPQLGASATVFGGSGEQAASAGADGSASPGGYSPPAPAAGTTTRASGYPVAGVSQPARASGSKASTPSRQGAAPQEPAWEADISEDVSGNNVAGAAGGEESERAPIDAAVAVAETAQERVR
jgi:hypothetical protein